MYEYIQCTVMYIECIHTGLATVFKGCLTKFDNVQSSKGTRANPQEIMCFVSFLHKEYATNGCPTLNCIILLSINKCLSQLYEEVCT